jgi:hypothetical protein
LAVLAFHERGGFGDVGGCHVRAVPIHRPAFTELLGDGSEQDDLVEVGGRLEVRIGRGAAVDGIEPFLVMARRARDGFRDGEAGLVFIKWKRIASSSLSNSKEL